MRICIVGHKDADSVMSQCVAAFGLWVLEAVSTEDLEYVPYFYTDPTLIKEFQDVRYDRIYLLDTSFTPETVGWLQYFASIAAKVIWIDHHEPSTKIPNGDIPGNVTVVLGTTCSAAMLTWKFFFPELAIPRAVWLVSDYDTWTHSDPTSKALSAAIMDEEDLTFANEKLRAVLSRSPVDAEAVLLDMIKDGKALLRKRVTLDADRRRLGLFYADLTDEHGTVPVVALMGGGNSDTFDKFINTHVCVMFKYETDGEKMVWKYSLYSGNDYHCGNHCLGRGGGGHAGAAGFSSTKFLFDNVRPVPPEDM